MKDREFRRRGHVEFLADVLDWRMWVLGADDLSLAADLLGERVKPHLSRFEQALATPRDSNWFELWLSDDQRLLSGYNLLLAYAMENLLKGLIVKKSPQDLATKILRKRGEDAKRNQMDYFDEAMVLPFPLDQHNLATLASEACFAVNANEEHFLKYFTRWSVWAGRYHVPKRSKDMSARMEVNLTENDPKKVAAMIARIRAAIEECPEPPKFQPVEG